MNLPVVTLRHIDAAVVWPNCNPEEFTLGFLEFNGQRLCSTLEEPWKNNQGGRIAHDVYVAKKRTGFLEVLGASGRGPVKISGYGKRSSEADILVGEFPQQQLRVDRAFSKAELSKGAATLRALMKALPNEFVLKIIPQ